MKAWNWFWFDSRSDTQLAVLGLFRFCFGLVVFFAYFSRSFDLDFFFSQQGIMPSVYRNSVEAFRFHPTFLDAVNQSWILYAVHGAFLFLVLLLSLGLFTRAAAVGVFLLHMAFINRNMGVLFGVDTIGTFFLLYLCFADSGRRFSLDRLWRGGPLKQGSMSHIAWRLMQIQVCVIYAYSGMEKLRGFGWWNGSAFWDVLSAGHLQRFDLSFVSHAPVLLSGMAYLLLLWELYFPVLVWMPRLRLPMLAFGVFLHLGIYFFMNLPSFGFMMISLYVLFLKENEIEGVVAYLRGFQLKKGKHISSGS